MRSYRSARRIVTFVTITSLAIWPTVSTGSVVVSLNNPGSTTLHEVTVAPGGTFSLDINVNATGIQITSIWGGVQASHIGVFSVLQVSDSAPWNSTGSGLVGALNPSRTFYSHLPFPLEFGPGSTTPASVVIEVASAAPRGDYSIAVVDPWAQWGLSSGDLTRGTPGPDFVAHIVPEPSIFPMILMAGLPLLRRQP
jgi:hypothetical protein